MGRPDAVLLIAIITAGLIPSGHAQQAPVFRATADIVQIDVSVLDRDRQPVHGLTAADFTVLDGGIEQPIVAFAAVDVPDRVRTGAPWTRDVSPDVVTNHLGAQRVVLILFDDCSTRWDPSVLRLSRRIGKAAVDELGPRDLASVIYTSARRNGQELTTDRQRLMAAVERFIPQSPAGGVPPGPFSASRPSGGLRSGSDATAGMASGMCLSGSAGSPLDQALRNAADILSEWPGARKTIILVSTSGVDFSKMTLDDNMTVDNLGRTFAAMQRANLNVYQFDPRGLEIGRKASDNFGILAENTGGRAFTDTNEPWEGVPQVFRENSSYYLLGFRRSNAEDGRFHKITVKVSRPGLEVRTRAGYYAARPERPAKPSGKPTPTAIEQALSKGLPTGDIPLSLSAVAAPVAGRKDAAVAVIAGLGAVDEAPAIERIDMTAAAFSDTWKPAATATQTIEIATGESDSRRATTDVPIRLDLKPGRYEIRLAVHSTATERTGSVYASVTVPDFAKAALAVGGVQIVGTEAGSSGPMAGDLSAPWPAGVTTRRAFRQNEAVSAVVRVAQLGAKRAGAVTIATIVQDGDGTEVSREIRELPVEMFATSRIVEHRATLPLRRLQPGDYLLTFEARSGSQIERAHMRFTVNGPQPAARDQEVLLTLWFGDAAKGVAPSPAAWSERGSVTESRHVPSAALVQCVSVAESDDGTSVFDGCVEPCCNQLVIKFQDSCDGSVRGNPYPSCRRGFGRGSRADPPPRTAHVILEIPVFRRLHNDPPRLSGEVRFQSQTRPVRDWFLLPEKQTRWRRRRDGWRLPHRRHPPEARDAYTADLRPVVRMRRWISRTAGLYPLLQ